MPKTGDIGEYLRKKWRLDKKGAKKYYFRTDGTYFTGLLEFPGALCDCRGYVFFESKEGYMRDSRLKQKRNYTGRLQTTVQGGSQICAFSEYKEMPKDQWFSYIEFKKWRSRK